MSELKSNLFSSLRRYAMLPQHILPVTEKRIDFIVEPKNWSIASDGINIQKHISGKVRDLEFRVLRYPFLSNGRIVHFGSQFMFQNWLPYIQKTQKIVVTYFHGKYGDNDYIDSNLKFLTENQERANCVVVSFELMKQRLIDLGVAASNITLIPVGVSTSVFVPPESTTQVMAARRSLGIPEGYKVIGSFQKDGEGWGEGVLPKLIKGPDLLIESLRLISQKFPIMVLLSGPARGYVKKQLEKFNVPYVHQYIKTPENLARFYKALDLYIVSSREEGGPKGLIEALSSGIPVVSTPVGLATDMAPKGEHFSIIKGFEAEEIADAAVRILSISLTPTDRQHLRVQSLKYDWSTIAQLHLEKVYGTL